MLTHLEQGDVAETIAHFFEASTAVQPAHKSVAVITKKQFKYLFKSENLEEGVNDLQKLG